jgi:hypothetical protein
VAKSCPNCGGNLFGINRNNFRKHYPDDCIRSLNAKIVAQGEVLDSLINALAEGGIVKITIKETNGNSNNK